MAEVRTVGELVERLPHAAALPAPVTPMQMLQIAVERGADGEPFHTYRGTSAWSPRGAYDAWFQVSA